MHQLWSYQDYVERLNHPNNLVRIWAFEAIKKKFPRRYTTEIAILIGDSDEYLACTAPKYLAHHGATDHAPAILESFLKDKGNIPSNCAIALGDMHYELAVDAILDRLNHCESLNTFLGILLYLEKIRRDDCYQALRNIFIQISDNYFADFAAVNLIGHHHPEDVPLVFETYFKNINPDIPGDMFLKRLMSATGASGLYDDLTEYSSKDILETPKKAFKNMLKQHPMINPELKIINEIVRLIESGRYQHIATSLMFDARDIIRYRFPKGQSKNYLSEIYEYDTLTLAFLEEFSKRSSSWKQASKNKNISRNLVSAVLACYFSIQERGGYLQALDPEASCEVLINTLKNTGPEFPKTLQDRLLKLSPIEELKESLTEELLTWGDIWTVRLMGQIGDNSFVPDLIRVIRDTEGMAYIHEAAIRSLNGMDESTHKSLLSAIQDGELTDAWDIFPLLEHLPYTESFDIAQPLWNEKKMESFEMYALCLERIGDVRGIEALQEIFFEGNAIYIGDSLEILSLLYNKDIPELSTIQHQRKLDLERRKIRQEELSKLATEAEKQEIANNNITTIRRKTPKTGRNDPCPCGSGKKYKKCCLNK